MKLAHLADLHLGFRQYHRQTDVGLNQREVDVANAFRSAVDGVIAERPDAIVVAGDLFHSVRPSNPAILFAFNQFQRIREALPEVPIVLIAGNHDTPRSSETGSILALFDSLGVDVVAEQPRRLVYPRLDLSVLAVPHTALIGAERPALRPEGKERYQVLVTHGEVEGVLPRDRSALEYGGATIRLDDLRRGEWSYIALGHYHVQREVAPRAWYVGALEYSSTNPWGELAEERAGGQVGKAWLAVDLETGRPERRPVTLARRFIDLPPIAGEGRSAEELDREIAARVAAVSGGIKDQVVRLVVRDVPRHVARALNYGAVRNFKVEALHFDLDIRRPEIHRETGMGAPGRRQTLPELVQQYLAARLLPPGVDRDAFVKLGTELVDAVERELQES